MSPKRVAVSSLPSSLGDLTGRRAARWTRESTGKLDPATGKPAGGQWDSFGPDAQREQQSRAIERFGLIDVTVTDPSLDFRVAHSGRTIGTTAAFAEMLQRAGEDFDILVVGYVSRFARDLRTAVNARHDLHERGAVILFADEGVLSSDERHWKDWADEAVEAEAYSRKLGRRIAEGYEAKRRRLGEPGGQPPYGFARDGGKPPVLVEVPERIELVRSMYRWAAEGHSDLDIAHRSGLRKTHVSEILTNPFYRGVLRDGARRAAVIGEPLWAAVQNERVRHTHRHPGPTTYRRYLLSGLIRCRACGRALTGHGGRYRHVDACLEFRGARPRALADSRGLGDSYAASTYDAVIGEALERVVATASLVAEVEGALDSGPTLPDGFTLARIRRERAEATRKLEADRDVAAWQATMARLDAEEAEAEASQSRAPTLREIADSLADLRGLLEGAEPATAQRIAQALFEQVEVLGPNEIWLYPSLEAKSRGWATAMKGGWDSKERQTGRGERI